MKILAILATLFLSAPAFADLHLEPYLGYETGELSGTNSVDLKGSNLGLKLGYSTLGFSVGADYMMGDLTADSSPSQDYDAKDLGVYAQYTFPILIKVGLTYFLDSKLDGGGSEFTGKGTKIGVGFTGLPFIAINFDMIRINYDEVKTILGTFTTDVDRETYLVSVSLPFDL